MDLQLQLFGADARNPLTDDGDARHAAGSTMIRVEQPPMHRLLPERYLRGLPAEGSSIRPFETALVMRGTGVDVECVEMSWGRDGAMPVTRYQRYMWPQIGHGMRSQRCILAASRFAALRKDEAQSLLAWISPVGNDCLYLGGYWRMTDGGPAFSLIEQRAAGVLRHAGKTMPLILGEDRIWPWLNGSPWIVPPELRRPQGKQIVALTTVP